ncbi:MAG TPA: sulfatase [Pseudonocardiaceae bacterium]|jgi:hypothetical protein|nr:sulfatase [Pseudonocardiaceae bacterium]
MRTEDPLPGDKAAAEPAENPPTDQTGGQSATPANGVTHGAESEAATGKTDNDPAAEAQPPGPAEVGDSSEPAPPADGDTAKDTSAAEAPAGTPTEASRSNESLPTVDNSGTAPGVAASTGTTEPPVATTDDAAVPATRPKRRIIGRVGIVLACLFVLFALVAPNDFNSVTVWDFLRIPVEALVGLALVLVLPKRARWVVALVIGVILGLLTVLKIINMGFFAALDRPFDPVSDFSFFGPGINFVQGAIGKAGAIATVIGAVVLAIAVVLLMTLAVLRLSRIAAGHRVGSARTVAVLAVVWVIFAVFGVQVTPGEPIAARSAATLAYDNVQQARADIKDQQVFTEQAATDPFGNTPGSQLLTGLRGKNVILAFVESYGQVAVQGSDIAPQIDTLLKNGTATLKADGFSSESAFLTSSTTGGGSWLAHSTLESGLWINNEQRYNEFTGSNRLTVTSAFHRAGWRTVGDVPENTVDWPQGAVYDFSKLYDSRNVGYQGPSFAYSNMPDQFTMSAFQRLELAAPNHPPVMAEVDLTSSHSPWTHLPRLVGWNQVGNGTIFGPMPAQGQAFNDVWPDPTKVRAAYGQSIQYSLSTLISFVQNYGDKNTVLILLGDHQPASIVVGDHASRNVPITIIAHDPNVLKQISGWGWQQGMLPDPQAPVWGMDTFRNRFLTAFSK